LSSYSLLQTDNMQLLVLITSLVPMGVLNFANLIKNFFYKIFFRNN